MNDDEYAPALDMGTSESADEASATDHHARVTTTDAPAAPRGDNPNTPPPTPNREPRIVSDKTRAMFRELAAKVKAGEVSVESDDLVPVEHDAAPEPVETASPPAVAVAAPVVPVTASPAAQAAAALPAPVPRPAPVAPTVDVGKAAEEQRKLLADMREKQLADREAKLAEREKALPSREKLLESPVPTLAQFIRDTYGITDDADLKDTITDLMTEMSETYHGVKLPDEIKNRVESRKAVRSVKAYKANLDRQQADLIARSEAQTKADAEAREKADAALYEQRAVAQLTELVGAAQASYPYLAVQEGHAAIVWEVLKEQHSRGMTADWASAAQYANDYYKQEHERTEAEAAKRATRLKTLLAPVATPAPAKAVASPGGASGPAPTPPAPAALQPPAKPQVDPADDIVGEDRRESRARSLRKLVAKHGLGANNAR